MPWGVRLTVLAGNGRTVHEFPRFPIRIGRNPLNDLHLTDNSVSQFHALLELRQGELALRDLGSRNGTAVPGLGRLQANTIIPITDAGNEFYVAQYFIRAELVDLSSESLSQMGQRARNAPNAKAPEFSASAILNDRSSAEAFESTELHKVPPAEATLLAHAQPHLHPQVGASIAGAKPRGRDSLPSIAEDEEELSARTIPQGGALSMRFKSLYDNYRESWKALFDAIQTTVGPLDDELRENACAELARSFPALSHETDFRALKDPIPVNEATVVSQQGSLVRATTALTGLQRLAAVYHPQGRELSTPEDVALFLEKLFEVLDLFFRCFIPLRDGYRAFTTQLDLNMNTRGEGVPVMKHPGAATVDSATTTTQLGAALLDWRAPADPTRAQPSQIVEWVFADLMIHHMAMITGVMQGVKSLLGELSPAAIERMAEDPKRSGGGLQIGPFRYKQLWEMYATRHSDLTDEDKETFALIFGADFARAYSQLASDTHATATNRMSSQFPTRTPSVARMTQQKKR